MQTISEINSQIAAINQLFSDFLNYIDSIEVYSDNLELFVPSQDLISAVDKSIYSSVQTLEQLKKDSLKEAKYTVISDTTIFNLCFLLYKNITKENIERLIVANDLLGYDNAGKEPYSPIVRKGTEIIYYQ